MYVCICNAVTESEVCDAREDGVSTLDELQRCLGVATGCGQCADSAIDLLKGAADTLESSQSACCFQPGNSEIPRRA